MTAPGDRPRAAARPGRQTGLRPLSELPPRAKLFLVAVGVALVGFAVWVTIRLLRADSLPLAIVVSVFSYIGAVVLGVAVVTATRMLFSLRAMPYLLGRGMRRLLIRR